MPDTTLETENLRSRVYLVSDKVDRMELAQARLEGRIDSCEGSIDRLTASSATSVQVEGVKEVVTLKLNHLLTNQTDMKKQITRSTYWVFFCVICGIASLLFAVYMGMTR